LHEAKRQLVQQSWQTLEAIVVYEPQDEQECQWKDQNGHSWRS
jgi:hypothetical protein